MSYHAMAVAARRSAKNLRKFFESKAFGKFHGDYGKFTKIFSHFYFSNKKMFVLIKKSSEKIQNFCKTFQTKNKNLPKIILFVKIFRIFGFEQKSLNEHSEILFVFYRVYRFSELRIFVIFRRA